MESSLTISGSQPNAVTYSAAIIACARLADWQRAVELKDQMLARWAWGDTIAWLCLQKHQCLNTRQQRVSGLVKLVGCIGPLNLHHLP